MQVEAQCAHCYRSENLVSTDPVILMFYCAMHFSASNQPLLMHLSVKIG